MSEIPADLKYIETHQWVRVADDGTATVGITDFAQDQLGDIVFIGVPDVGATVTGAEEAGVAESVKSASDVFSPVTGEVIEVNESLEDEPEKVNEDPYGDGWLFRVRLADAGELDGLMDSTAYAEHVAAEDIHQLQRAWELHHRLLASESVTHHTLFRKETRWPGYYYRGDHMKLDDDDWHVFTLSQFDRESGEWTMEKAPVYHIID